MPQDFQFSFTFGGEKYEGVVLTWGLDGRRRRRGPAQSAHNDDDWAASLQEGWAPDPRDRDQGVGWTIDVHDMHRMLAAVQDGRATIDDLRDTLRALTNKPSERSGCCVECDNSIEHHAADVQRWERARARFDDPAVYPFLVTQKTIHAWDCYRFTGHLPDHPGNSVRAYVHQRDPYSSAVLARLSPEEATAWMDARTGPKGGLNWRRCRVCQPALPGAWDSESNDVPLGPGVPRS